MGRARNPNREKAHALYKKHNGKITNREIASILGEDERIIAVWKKRDNWDNSNVVQHSKSNQCCTTKTARKMLESVEENEELSERERLFCFHYIRTFNQRTAFIKAGYSDKKINAYQIMQRPKIIKELKRLKEIRHQEYFADGDDVIDLLMRIAFADVTDFVNFGKKDMIIEEESISVNYVDFRESEKVDGQLISEVKKGKDGISVKLADRLKALQMLTNFFDINPKDKRKGEYDKHKMELDKKRLDLEIQKLENGGSEDALHKLDTILEGINKGISND